MLVQGRLRRRVKVCAVPAASARPGVTLLRGLFPMGNIDRSVKRFFDSCDEWSHGGGMSNPTNDTTSVNVARKGRRTVAAKRARASLPKVVSSEADIARRAYLIYLEEGCPQGRHLEHWVQAETELRG
jgi:hypothetical protein